MPKQFVPLIGQSSTFRQVLERVSDEGLFEPPIIITNSQFRFIVAEQVLAVGIHAKIVLEPSRRDSGPAITVGAEIVAQANPTGIVLVLASDHIIRDAPAFLAACRDAVSAASAGRIVIFGVRPTSPSTSYGYILPGQLLDNLGGAADVEAFVEKPDKETATRYLQEGYLWNSGNFMFRADVMLGELARYEPAMGKAVKAALAKAQRDLDFLRLDAETFENAPRKSIDYAVMEHTKLAAILSLDCGWSDVGNWNAAWEIQDRDHDGNVKSGPVELLDTHNSLVHSDGAVLISVVGCQDIIVVSTSDSVLVIRREDSERVKSLVEVLRKNNRKEAVEHRKMFRPWGYYQGVDVGDRYQVKRIVVNAGCKLSLQKHFHRAEHWVVVKGTAEITNGNNLQIVHENESVYIPIGNVHRLTNPGRIPLELIEVQVGSYLGEDDIVRLEDVYRRE
jgi:mannose-1-phosphate guanylyltransferase/mannose-6-phosphate isomerase